MKPTPEPTRSDARPGSYAVVERAWKSGDRLEVEWPLAIRAELLPHRADSIAVLWGPVALAGELGTAGLSDADFHNHNFAASKRQPIVSAPVFAGAAGEVAAKVKPLAGQALVFQMDGLAGPAEMTLAPLYRVHHQRYAVYWKLKPSAGANSANPAR